MRKPVLWNLLLALFWVFATGAFTFANLLLGYAIGFILLAVGQRAGGPKGYVRKCIKWLDLVLFFLGELIVANLRVAYDVLTPKHHMRPGIVAVPLEARTDAEIVVLASIITLTPGTLCIDVSSDRTELYIHAMYIGDVEAFRERVKSGFERRLLEAMR